VTLVIFLVWHGDSGRARVRPGSLGNSNLISRSFLAPDEVNCRYLR
jgi:hypothetical protein